MQKFDAFDSGEDVNGKKKKKHVILSMAEIKDHEMDKKKDQKSLRFLQKRKTSEFNEYPSKQMLDKIKEKE